MSKPHVRIIPIQMEGSESDSENRNETSVNIEHVPVRMETSESNEYNEPTGSSYNTSSTLKNINSDSFLDNNSMNIDDNQSYNKTTDIVNTEFLNNRNLSTFSATKPKMSYSAALGSSGQKNNENQFTILEDNQKSFDDIEYESQLSKKKGKKKPAYTIKTLSEVITEEDQFYKKFLHFKGRFSNASEVEATYQKPRSWEKVVFIIDCGADEFSTPFCYKRNKEDRFSSLKRNLYRYLHVKRGFDKNHEFAIILLNENSAIWYLDFTRNIQIVKQAISSLNDDCEVEDIFSFNEVFELLKSIEYPDLHPREQTPVYLIHPIIFYNRTYTIPEYEEENYRDLLGHEHFVLDVVMTHEPIGSENNVEQISMMFRNMMKPEGNGIVLPVGRNYKRLVNAIYRTLGHPNQRAWQVIKDL